MKYSYYPGCSLKGLGKAYEESFLAVFKALGVEVAELDNWNCCGATAYMSLDEAYATRLAARNLCLAEQAGCDLVTPCAGCYLVLNKSKKYIEKYPKMKNTVQSALNNIGLKYGGGVEVRHPLEVLINDIGLKTLKEKIKKPLKSLRVACYYGCQIVRPYAVFDDQNNPTVMDDLISTTGANVVNYPLKTRCCGGSLTGTISDVGQRLCYILLKEVKKRGAEVMVTACPLCQFNLEAYQDKISQKYENVKIPVLFFTQLLGVALGLSETELGLQRQIVPIAEILKEKALMAA